jgi:LPXTG-motif cell wall-anchored protein
VLVRRECESSRRSPVSTSERITVKKTIAAIAGAVALVVSAAPSVANAQVPNPLPSESIAEVATNAGTFGTLLQAATAAGLDTALADCTAGPFTVFAPTDDAFAAVDADLLAAALADPNGLLTEILEYHVVPGIVPAADVVAATSLTTAQGADIAVNNTVLNGSVNITTTDLFACNGVVHVIDAVLLPPSIAEVATDGGFNTLVAALTAADLADTFADCTAGPFTVFAPTDAAFEAALTALGLTADELLADTETLTKVLQYHVVPGIAGAAEVTAATSLTTLQGEDITVAGTVLNGSVNITATDNWACNGVVHVVDAVLLPPSMTAPPTTTTVVTPTTVSPELPATGTGTTVLALLAGLLVLAGGGLLLARRRPTA